MITFKVLKLFREHDVHKSFGPAQVSYDKLHVIHMTSLLSIYFGLQTL